MKKILCGYQIASKLPKGEFKRLTDCVIDFDKVTTRMWVIRTTQEQLSRITILGSGILLRSTFTIHGVVFNQCPASKPFKSR